MRNLGFLKKVPVNNHSKIFFAWSITMQEKKQGLLKSKKKIRGNSGFREII